jgi:hypothetical protein
MMGLGSQLSVRERAVNVASWENAVLAVDLNAMRQRVTGLRSNPLAHAACSYAGEFTPMCAVPLGDNLDRSVLVSRSKDSYCRGAER